MRCTANPYTAGSDEFYMREALNSAHEGLGWSSPNPMVGCVLVRDGVVLARAGHRHDGQEHAEVLALQQAGAAAQGSTCYVTLEPCCHVCRQPACCDELVRAGVARVVYGCHDTDPRTAQLARDRLTEKGLAVTAGVLAAECERLLDSYLLARRLTRPFAHLKLALSADAKVACANGASQWLSGPQSLGLAHYLRQKYDAVLVGWRTVLADDPRLTVRPEVVVNYRPLAAGVAPRHPVRVVLDPHLRLAGQLPHLRLADFSGSFRQQLPRLVLACGPAAQLPEAPLPAGTEILRLSQRTEGGLAFASLLEGLWRLGVQSLLVEGGAGVAQELLHQRQVDKLTLVFTPLLIGSDGLGFSPPLHLQALAEAPRLAQPEYELLGPDVALTGYPLPAFPPGDAPMA
jgi:diaminohydroxyphosphoribosylaminopyrimidine deaminase / 5-amino-6-(5-phosphoribosylamino)uracil reductase